MRRKGYVHVISVFSSYQVMVLEDSSDIRHRWLYLAKHVLFLMSHRNCNMVKIPEQGLQILQLSKNAYLLAFNIILN